MTQIDIWSDHHVSDITDNEMDSFKNLVIADIKGSLSENDREALKANLNLWNYHLQVLRRDMELQLSCQRAKAKLQARSISDYTQPEAENVNAFLDEQEKWRMSALKFLSNIEKKSLYVKLLISENS